jgi:hypothetical protein
MLLRLVTKAKAQQVHGDDSTKSKAKGRLCNQLMEIKGAGWETMNQDQVIIALLRGLWGFINIKNKVVLEHKVSVWIWDLGFGIWDLGFGIQSVVNTEH